MIELKAGSGHSLRVADEAAAARWAARGYRRVEESEPAKPARKATAKKSASRKSSK